MVCMSEGVQVDSEFDGLGAVVVCKGIWEESHAPLEQGDGGVLSFRVVANFRLWFLIVLLFLVLLFLIFIFIALCFCGLGLFAILQLRKVSLRVEMHIDSVGALILEEQGFEMFLELLKSEGLEGSDLMLLSIKSVLMSAELSVPVSVKLLLQVLVFLLEIGENGSDLSLELFFSHFINLGSHSLEMDLDTVPQMKAILLWRLHQEPSTIDSSHLMWS